MTGSKSSALIVIMGVIGAVFVFRLLNPYAPLSSIDLQYTRSQIEQRSREFLLSLGYDTEGLYADINFDFGSGTTHYLETIVGLQQAHRILRADTLLVHSWETYLFDRDQPPSQMPDQYRVRMSPTGKIIAFEHILRDSVARPSLELEEAKTLAHAFLLRAGHNVETLTLENSSVNQRVARTDYAFEWVGPDSVYGLSRRYTVDVYGDKVGRYEFSLEKPDNYNRQVSGVQTFVNFIVTISSTATFVLLIFIISLFLKKYHDGEVGIKTGIFIFVLLFGLTGIDYALRFTTIGYHTVMGDVNRFNTRIIVFIVSLFIIQAFMSAMVFAGWSVGESSSRQGWSRKLRAIDGLNFGKFFTVELANAITRGYGFGFILLGILMAGLVLFEKVGNASLYFVNPSGIIESKAPALSVIVLAFRISLLNEIIFRFFSIAWLREKTKKTWLGVIISSLVWSLLAFTLWDFPFGYLGFRILFPTYFLFSLILGLIVVRFDLMTAVVTNFVVLAIGYAVPILTATAPFYQLQTWLIYIFMATPLALALAGYVKRQHFEFTPELTPTHIKRISERERMARELEIARNVQMSLLPKENPLLEGYDIAGICIPALEVGGDYYDFFQLGNGKVGIAIGDVSGKGVPAAIYMTLTKGILQSHAGESNSPKEVLRKLNRQMYTNIDRSSFVSMFYAVLDMKRNKIRFSRAGHNPAILAQRSTNKSTLIQPKGIALGLEAGERFQTCLEEHEMPLQSGDVLTFYTDGFTEASNSEGEEFGESRLESEISSNKTLSANIIIQKVVRSVKQFVGNHPQHDDMTMVVIKVL